MMDTATSGDSVRLELEHFGPIVKGTVDLRPFTLFVGPSNTGKSYVAMLVYALHMLFGMRQRAPVRYRRDIALSPRGAQRVAAWVKRLVAKPETMTETLRRPLPKELHESVYPLLKRFGQSGSTVKTEIARCFGVPAAEHLIRAGADEASVVLQRFVGDGADRELPFMYALRVGGKRPGFVASIPKNKPLRIDERQAYFVDRWMRFAAAPEMQGMDPDERNGIATGIVQDIAESVVPYVTGPLSRPAHYLPADRAGVMHAHRVVVASVVERASSSGILPAPQVPILSGVLGDFLRQLITFEENRLNHNEVMEKLTERLERDVLGASCE